MMSLKVPAPLRRIKAIKDDLERHGGTGIVCLVIPFEITSMIDPRERHSENLVYAGRPEPARDAESRASTFRHMNVQAFVAHPDKPYAWFYDLHARRMADRHIYNEMFGLVRYPGPKSRVRSVAPEFLTYTQAMGYANFNEDFVDRMGNPWFLRHLRSEVGAVPIPDEFRP